MNESEKMSPVWLNLQTWYDLELAEDALGQRIEQEVRPRAVRRSAA